MRGNRTLTADYRISNPGAVEVFLTQLSGSTLQLLDYTYDCRLSTAPHIEVTSQAMHSSSCMIAILKE
jgi:hypothetical protein